MAIIVTVVCLSNICKIWLVSEIIVQYDILIGERIVEEFV